MKRLTLLDFLHNSIWWALSLLEFTRAPIMYVHTLRACVRSCLEITSPSARSARSLFSLPILFVLTLVCTSPLSAQTIPVRGGIQSQQPSALVQTTSLPDSSYPYWPAPSPYAYGGPLFPYYGSAAPYYPTYNYSGWMPPVMPPMPMPTQPIMDPSMMMGMPPMPMQPMPPMPSAMNQPQAPQAAQGSQAPQMTPDGAVMFPGYLWSRTEGRAVPATSMADADRMELERWRELSKSKLNVTIYDKEALIEWGGSSYKTPIGSDNRFQIQVPPPTIPR